MWHWCGITLATSRSPKCLVWVGGEGAKGINYRKRGSNSCDSLDCVFVYGRDAPDKCKTFTACEVNT